MNDHNIGFYEEMSKIIFQLSSNTNFICSSVQRNRCGYCIIQSSYRKYEKILPSVIHVPILISTKNIFFDGFLCYCL